MQDPYIRQCTPIVAETPADCATSTVTIPSEFGRGTTPPDRDAALTHYRALADAAQAPLLRDLLVQARLRISDMDPLALRIDDALGLTLPAEETDLVWEQIPNGEWGWFKADLTNGRQRA